MAVWREFERDATRLAYRDHGGAGPPVILLHGLAGHAGEWDETAGGLSAAHRVLALDQRGHGRSERHPRDLSREAYVADVAHLIELLQLAPVVLVGQSMGGNTALLAAAAHPQCVAALVVVEASPDGPAPDLPERIRLWLARWPVPFGSPDEAKAFFDSEGLAPEAWIAGLEHRPDGLRPAFDPAVITKCIAELAARSYWPQWRTIGCPTLIVRGQRGNLTAEHVEQLRQLLTCAETATIPDAGHDVHLDNPASWLVALREFIERPQAGRSERRIEPPA